MNQLTINRIKFINKGLDDLIMQMSRENKRDAEASLITARALLRGAIAALNEREDDKDKYRSINSTNKRSGTQILRHRLRAVEKGGDGKD